MTHPDATPLLIELHAVGESMLVALADDELAPFFELVERRGRLVERLREAPAPAEPSAEWRALTERLAAQHERLRSAMAGRERGMEEEIATIERFHQAQKHYTPAAPRGRILRSSLAG